MRDKGFERISATPEAEEAWTEHAESLTEGMLAVESDTKSWFMGTNIPGKKRAFLLYAGGGPVFRQKVSEVAASDYKGFLLR